MDYKELIAKQDVKKQEEKCFLLYKHGLYEMTEVSKLPEHEVVSEKKGLTCFKDVNGYGIYGTKMENNEVYGYDIYRFNVLTEDEFNEFSAGLKKNSLSKVYKVFEIVGWVAAGLSFVLFVFTILKWLQEGDTGIVTAYAFGFAGAYFAGLVVSLLLVAYCMSSRCKDIS